MKAESTQRAPNAGDIAQIILALALFGILIGYFVWTGLSGRKPAPPVTAAPQRSATAEAALRGSPWYPANGESSRVAAKGPFMPCGGNLFVGTQLFMKDTHHFFGSVKDIGTHAFDDGISRDGVRVQFANGGERWVPREAAKVLYVVKAGE